MEPWREELHEDLYHAFKGREWKNHKYIRKEGNRYIYPEDLKKGRNKGWLSDAANAISNTASSVASTVGTYATTATNAVSNTANTVAQEAGNVWNNVSTAVGSTATSVYNNISSTVNSAIESLKNDPSWPKQKGDKPNSDGGSRATMAEKKEGAWNERLNTYIKARLAKIGDNQEQFEELYTAVSWLVAKALYNMDSQKVATPSTPLWHGLDAASLAQAIGVDPSDASSDLYTSLMYCLWSVLDAKRTGSKNPLVEGKKEHNVVQNAWNSVTGKTQQVQNALARVNANASKRTSTTQLPHRSVVIKPKRQILTQSDIYTEELYHHGIKGQRWGIRRFQNEDGTLTEAGKKRYAKNIADIYSKKSDYYNTDLHRVLADNYSDFMNKTEVLRNRIKELDAQTEKEFEDYEKDREKWCAITGAAAALNGAGKDIFMDDLCKDIYMFTIEDWDQGNINSKSVWAQATNKTEHLNNLEQAYVDANTEYNRYCKDYAQQLIGPYYDMPIPGKGHTKVGSAFVWNLQDVPVSKLHGGMKLDDVSMGKNSGLLKSSIDEAKSLVAKLGITGNGTMTWNIVEALEDAGLYGKTYSEMTDSDWAKFASALKQSR